MAVRVFDVLPQHSKETNILFSDSVILIVHLWYCTVGTPVPGPGVQ